MAINVVTATRVSDELGVSRWVWIPLLPPGALDNASAIPYAEIPPSILPSSKFQVASETSTCTLIAPWGGFTNAFDEFLLGGGTSGTLVGALTGLSIVEQSFLQPTTANYGLGQQYLGPEFGYCMGTHFKEKIYSSVNAQFSPEQGGVFVGESNEDIIWRSKWERFYVNHGKINGFAKTNNGLKITIETNAKNTSVGEIDFGDLNDKITLYKFSNGDSAMYNVEKVIGIAGGLEIYVSALEIGDSAVINGENITVDSENINFKFTSGDYFTLSTSWLIQDPYLMDGLLSEISSKTTPTGSEEFFRTDQNQIISEGSFTGVYLEVAGYQVEDKVIVDSLDRGTIISVNE